MFERRISRLRKNPLKNPIRHDATRATSNARSCARLWEWLGRDAFGAARGGAWLLIEATLDTVDPGFKSPFVPRFPLKPPGGKGGIGKQAAFSAETSQPRRRLRHPRPVVTRFARPRSSSALALLTRDHFFTSPTISIGPKPRLLFNLPTMTSGEQ
jgi:hypothetical protein